MRSPPLEWTLGVGYLVALNLLRNQGEPDLDTPTECTRAVTDTIPHGDVVFAGVLVGAGVGCWYHICRPGRLLRHRAVT